MAIGQAASAKLLNKAVAVAGLQWQQVPGRAL
jgi:hypothetical protein